MQPIGCLKNAWANLKKESATMPTPSTDRIEKQVLLRAPRARVWQALVDADRFGQWFGARFNGAFVQGTIVSGEIAPTTMDDEIARMQAPHAGLPLFIEIVRLEPQTHFAFRWHPHAVDGNADYTPEPTTLVEFTLTDVDGGVMLTVTESGFDAIAIERRATAFEQNAQGWTMQMKLIGNYVARPD